MKRENKIFIWSMLVGGLLVPLTRISFLNWQWWVYVLIVIPAAFWAFETEG